ncbi:MAG: dynamin family protein [Pseudomonadota bacterium]
MARIDAMRDRLAQALATCVAATGSTSQRLTALERATAEYAPTVTLIGQVKAGKTALANALSGRPGLLPVQVNPYTAVVTRLLLSPPGTSERSEFDFFGDADWRALTEGGGALGAIARRAELEDEARELADQIAMMRETAKAKLGQHFETLVGRNHAFDTVTTALLERYVAAGDEEPGREHVGRYAEITRAARLIVASPVVRTPLVLCDTPGVNDPFLVREQVTLSGLSHSDICVLVLSAHQALTTVDVALFRLCATLDVGRIVIFVNRMDELEDAAGQRVEIERRLREALTRHALPSNVTILFGSALAAQSGEPGADRASGVAALREHLDASLADSTVREHFRALALEALNIARIELLVASKAEAEHRRTRPGRSETIVALDRIVAETERQLQEVLKALHETLVRRVLVIGREIADRECQVVAEEAATRRVQGWAVDTIGLRRQLKENYDATMAEGITSVGAVLEASARRIERLYMALLPPDIDGIALDLPALPTPRPPVAIARTLSVELDASWWRRLLMRERGIEELQRRLRGVLDSEITALGEEVIQRHFKPFVACIGDVVRDFLSAEAERLIALADEDAEAERRAAMAALGADPERLDALAEAVATLEAIGAEGAGQQRKATAA